MHNVTGWDVVQQNTQSIGAIKQTDQRNGRVAEMLRQARTLYIVITSTTGSSRRRRFAMCSSACSGEESSSTTRIGEGASAGGSEGAALVELDGGGMRAELKRSDECELDEDSKVGQHPDGAG